MVRLSLFTINYLSRCVICSSVCRNLSNPNMAANATKKPTTMAAATMYHMTAQPMIWHMAKNAHKVRTMATRTASRLVGSVRVRPPGAVLGFRQGSISPFIRVRFTFPVTAFDPFYKIRAPRHRNCSRCCCWRYRWC